MTKKRELAGYKSELSKHANIIKQELNSIKSKKITELKYGWMESIGWTCKYMTSEAF